jgi:hypothetical protein
MKTLSYYLKLFFRDKVVDYYGTWFGREVHLRIDPKAFTRAYREISRLIDDECYDEARAAMEQMGRFYDGSWHNDPEMIRASSLMNFMEAE